MVNRYLLDANVLISSHRIYYPFDIAPGFWNYLIEKGKDGIIAFPKPVKDEILDYKDDLSEWLKNNESHFITIQSSDPVVIEKYSTIINSVYKNNTYNESAKRKFASLADSWLIASAWAYDFTIVTEEVYRADCIHRVIIPNECKRHGVKFINRTEFMRATYFLWR